MKKIVCQAKKLCIFLGNHGVNRLRGVEETRPGHLRNLGGKCVAPVKTVVAFPERLPLGKICGHHRTNRQWSRHGDSSVRFDGLQRDSSPITRCKILRLPNGASQFRRATPIAEYTLRSSSCSVIYRQLLCHKTQTASYAPSLKPCQTEWLINHYPLTCRVPL